MQSVGCESKPWPRLLFCASLFVLVYYVTVCDDPVNPSLCVGMHDPSMHLAKGLLYRDALQTEHLPKSKDHQS